MYVQGIYKFTENGDQRRIIAGTIETGTITTDDEVTFLPSERSSRYQQLRHLMKRKNKLSPLVLLQVLHLTNKFMLEEAN